MVSFLAEQINDSPTLSLAQYTRTLKEQGKDIVDLGTGHLSFEPPALLVESIKKSLDITDKAKYIPVAGLSVLRDHIADMSQVFYQQTISGKNILIGSGAKTVIYTTLLTIINPGDEVLVLAPYWPSYIEQIRLVGGVPIVVESNNTCHMDVNLILTHITEKTRCIITNSPNNPSGVVYTKDAWLDLLQAIQSKDIFLLSDEMYKSFVFDENFVSPLMLANKKMQTKIIVIDGLSKNIAIPGWRVGWAIADTNIITAMSKIQSNMTGNAISLIQHGLLEFFEHNDRSFVDAMRLLLSTSRGMIMQMLNKARIAYIYPSGSLYFFINIGQKKSVDFCQDLIKHGGVSAVPGLYFGKEGYIRICYAMDSYVVKEGITRLISFIQQ